jgi:hypothetical protein
MRFNCAQCGIDFASAEEWMAHKRMHQPARQVDPTPGVICLGCGKKIPVGPDKANYKGPLPCPSCRRTMTVVLENGEVCFARLG